MLKKVAITGTISSGKSTVLSYFRSWGAYTVSADSLLHDVFSIDTPIGQKILELFGPGILLPDGRMDKTQISKHVANNKERQQQLEQICHPYVKDTVKHLYDKCLEQPEKWRLFVAEIPLLFEATCPLADWFDVICVIETDPTLARQRFLQTGKSLEQFSWRYERQMPTEEKKKRAHYSIENNGSLDELQEATKRLFTILVQI